MKKIRTNIFEFEECPDANEIIAELKAFNVGSIGPANRKGLTISLREDDGTLVAGLISYTHWDWLFINILWVKDGFRGKSFGTKIVMQAEEIAAQRGCKGAHLDTFDFQAPGFYEKLSYQRIGIIEDCPVKGKQRIFYKKYFAL